MTNKAVSRIAIAFLCVVGLALLVFIGFMAIIVIACGQYKPPVHEEEECVVPMHLQATSVLVPNGSYWTDGAICYQAKRQGNTLRLTGWSLHEGGMECSFAILNDTLMQVLKDGTFAEEGSLVTHHRITQASGKQLELFLAWEDSTLTIPYAALQRFSGDLDGFEQRAYCSALAGYYYNDKDTAVEWTFYPNGTVSLARDQQPQPYCIERIYHALTDVILLPNGQRISFMINDRGLALCGVNWNEEEEYWETDNEVTDSFYRIEGTDWVKSQLFCLPIGMIAVEDYVREQMLAAFNSPDIFSQINGHLMHYFLYGGASNFEPIEEYEEEVEE